MLLLLLAACDPSVHLVDLDANPSSTDTNDTAADDTARTELEVTPRLAAGPAAACAIDPHGAVRCWRGANPSDLLGAPWGRFQAIDVSLDVACGVRLDGSVACWPLVDTGVDNLDVAPPDDLGPARDVAVGEWQACALLDDGGVRCWGTNADGQADAPAGRFLAVTAGRSYSCGLRADASLACWGTDAHGETDAPSGSYADVVASREGGFTCALGATPAGGGHPVSCWGEDAGGVVGEAPAAVFDRVSVGTHHACGLDHLGHVSCWGDDTGGEVAGADPSAGFTDVAAGGSFTCALDALGGVRCWGGRGAPWGVDGIATPTGR